MNLCLGTVQFGLNYGIEKKRIDGNFERRDSFKIISKISSNSLNNINDLEELRNLLQISLDNLNISSLDGVLLHKPEDLKNNKLLDNLNILKEEGYFLNLGVSTYSPDEANMALELENIKYIQVPYNILDTRLDKIDFFKKAKSKNKTIFVRSIFLQGVLLKQHNKYPSFLEGLKEFDQFIESEIKKIGCTKLTFLLNFIKNNKKIDYIIVGIDSLENLEEIIEAYNYKGLEDYNYDKLRDKFINIPENLLNPSLWREK